MHPRPLALTSEQLHCIRQHAKLIPTVLRDKYLMAIADALTVVEVTDEAVAFAVHEALGQMLGGPPPCCNE